MMYTIENLLEIAIKSHEDYRYGKDCAKNYYLVFDAMACAMLMESQGIREIANIGPFNTHNIRAGDKVRIKKGSKLRGRNLYNNCAGKSYTVTVYRVSNGYVAGYVAPNSSDYADCVVVNAQVMWSGKNGWVWTDVNNVEKV